MSIFNKPKFCRDYRWCSQPGKEGETWMCAHPKSLESMVESYMAVVNENRAVVKKPAKVKGSK